MRTFEAPRPCVSGENRWHVSTSALACEGVQSQDDPHAVQFLIGALGAPNEGCHIAMFQFLAARKYVSDYSIAAPRHLCMLKLFFNGQCDLFDMQVLVAW